MKTTVFHKAGKRAISLAFALAVGVIAIYVAIPRAPAHAAPIGASDYLYSISFSTADIFKHKDREGQTHAGLYYSLDAGAFMPVPGSESYNDEIPQYTDFEVFDVYLSEDGLDYLPEYSEQWTQITEPLTGETFFALETAVSFQVNFAPTLSEVTVNPTDGHKVVKASFKSTSNSLFAFVSFGACGDYVLGYSFRVNGIPGSLIDGGSTGGGYTEEDMNEKYNEGVMAGRQEGYENGYQEGLKDSYDVGYENGYTDGKKDADKVTQAQLDAAKSEGYTEGHTAGYNEGKADAETEVFDEGYQAGIDVGYKDGYSTGFINGRIEGRSDVNAIKGLLPGVFGSVAAFFASTFGGMTIFGISVLDVFLTFVMIGLVSFVIRFVK